MGVRRDMYTGCVANQPYPIDEMENIPDLKSGDESHIGSTPISGSNS